VSRLREECVAAKEALSADTEVSVPVLLPNVQTEVRLTRAELEAMIRPALGDTLVVLRRTLRSAGVDPAALHSVLLVGGSSRIPLIAQMVGADLGKTVAFNVPGMMKITVRRKPATKATVKDNPFKPGEKMTVKAKPARNIVRIRPLKGLKSMV